MSLQATTWALYDAARDAASNEFTLDANEFRTLMVMADMADQNGRNIYPSAATLAELCGVTTRTIRTKLASLEAKGLIIRDDQSILAHIPANRRPIAWRLNMNGETTTPTAAAHATNDTRGENIAPQNPAGDPADLGVKTGDENTSGVKTGVKPDRKSGVKHAFTQTHSKGRTVEPREAARARETTTTPHTDPAGEARLAVWQPNAEAQTLATEAKADLTVEAEKFRCKQLADGHIAKNLDAAFTLWLRRGIEGGYLTRRTNRPCDTRPTPTTGSHKHTLGCTHVLDLLTQYETRFSHEGERGANPWVTARSRLAELLNHGTDPQSALTQILQEATA
ncbi:helix-turn-helix domain-containing protein [Bifidobacterium pseudolongum]|uniref:helix-turn-helix domain-containing protein n=1 Tax=Bifidobacterium pseudolongum TaxID=1694 RepID=UPI0010F1E447|nr:helix-turn-helix domain-containing protein [Bifidobacterium pseudolongum]RYQ70717.1 cryptic prophage protein [Bifidobacterium pseudolongum subsp. globosum]